MRIIMFFMALLMCAVIPHNVFAKETCAPQQVAVSFLEDSIMNLGETPLTLGKTFIAFPYAIQEWSINRSGEAISAQALVKFNASSGSWVTLTGGRKSWDILSLVRYFKVPQSTAEHLLQMVQQDKYNLCYKDSEE